MKILIPYCYDPSELRGGGGITYVHSLIKVLLEHDIYVKLIGVNLSGKKTFDHPNFTFLPIINRTDNWWRFLFKLNNSVGKIDTSDYIIHTHHPIFMYPFIKKSPKNKKICTFHGVPLDWVKINHPYFYGTLSPFYKQIEKKVLQNIDLATTAGYYPKKRLKERYNDINLENKIIPIPSGVDLVKFKPMNKNELKKKHGIDEFNDIIVYVGRLARIKNLKLLLKSFSLLNEVLENPLLIVVGTGESENEIKEFSNKLKLNNIIFKGNTGSVEVSELLNCADVLALTSLFEASPTVIRESLACGTPVVSTNVGDVNEVITSSSLGKIVDDFKEETFANALLEILNKDKSNYIQKRCRKVAVDNFGFEKVADQFIKIYRGLN